MGCTGLESLLDFRLMQIFSDSFLRELKQELQRLELQRVELDDRIGRLRAVLSGAASQLSLLDDHRTKGADDGTFKSLVLGIIRQHPGIHTPQITRMIRDRGLGPGGTTDLGHRVYNEIWRMRRKGEVDKVNDGGYIAVRRAGEEEP